MTADNITEKGIKPEAPVVPDASGLPEQIALETELGTPLVRRADEVIIEQELKEQSPGIRTLVYSRRWKYPLPEIQG